MTTTRRGAGPTEFTARVAAQTRSLMGFYDVDRHELARRLNVHDSWVGKRLNGDTEIGASDMFRIAQALGVKVVDLLPRSERLETVTGSYPPGHTPVDASVRAAVRSSPLSHSRRTALTGR